MEKRIFPFYRPFCRSRLGVGQVLPVQLYRLSTPSQGGKWGFKPCTLLAQLSNYMWGYFTSEEEAFFFESHEVAISSLNGVCVL